MPYNAIAHKKYRLSHLQKCKDDIKKHYQKNKEIYKNNSNKQRLQSRNNPKHTKNKHLQWIKKEDDLVLNSLEKDIEIANQIGKTTGAIRTRRWILNNLKQEQAK